MCCCGVECVEDVLMAKNKRSDAHFGIPSVATWLARPTSLRHDRPGSVFGHDSISLPRSRRDPDPEEWAPSCMHRRPACKESQDDPRENSMAAFSREHPQEPSKVACAGSSVHRMVAPPKRDSPLIPRQLLDFEDNGRDGTRGEADINNVSQASWWGAGRFRVYEGHDQTIINN